MNTPTKKTPTRSPAQAHPSSATPPTPAARWQPTKGDKVPVPALARYAEALTESIRTEMDLSQLPITTHPTGPDVEEGLKRSAEVESRREVLLARRAAACQDMAETSGAQAETDKEVEREVSGKEVRLEAVEAQRPMTPPNTGRPPPILHTSGVRVYSREWDRLPANRRYGRFACGCITPRATSIRTYWQRRPRKRRHKKYFGPTHSGKCQPAQDEVAAANIMRMLRQSNPGMIRG